MERTAVIPFESPCNMILGGMTGTGKTYFVYELLKHASVMFKTIARSIIYCFNVYQKPLFDQMKSEFI